MINEYNGVKDSSLTDEELTQNTGEDEKTVSGMNLYGLPMYTVTSSRAAPAPNLALGIKEGGNKSSIGSDKTQIQWVEPKYESADLLRSQRIELIDEAFLEKHQTEEGVYYSFNGITQTNINEPVQPRAGYITGTESFFPKGAVLESARYRTLSAFDPVIEGGQWGAETLSYEGEFTKEGFFPAIPFSVNTIAAQNGLPPLQSFVFIAGQFNQEKNEERLYEEIRYSTYYTAIETETDPPIIQEPEIELTGSAASIRVEGTDKDGDPLYRVLLLWTDGQGEWKGKNLTQSSGNPSVWEGDLDKKDGLEFFIQAVDVLGNVTYADNQGRCYHPFGETEPVPESIDLTLLMDLPLTGFKPMQAIESGNVPTDNAYSGATDGEGLILSLNPGEGQFFMLQNPINIEAGACGTLHRGSRHQPQCPIRFGRVRFPDGWKLWLCQSNPARDSTQPMGRHAAYL